MMALTRRIVFDGKPAGSVSIRANVQDLIARRSRYVAIIATVLTASLVLAWLMSWFAQRAISRPLAYLAEIARRVSGGRDYTARAELESNTEEVAVLIDAFNDMLSQIHSRDQSLLAAHEALEERVRQRTAELDSVNKELEAFSYSVSHDLRAPLRHVTGFAALLDAHAGERLDEQSRKYVKTIAAAAKRMGQLIDDLLSFSRMGRGQLSTRKVSMAALVEEAREEVMSAAEVAGRSIEWHVHDLPDVEGDPAMLRLVLVNLLSNAVKYSAPRTPARIEVSATVNDVGEPVFYVKDNGSVSTCNTRTSCSACFSACTRRRSSRAPALVWPTSGESCTGTVEVSGRRAPSIRARRSSSHCASRAPRNPPVGLLPRWTHRSK